MDIFIDETSINNQLTKYALNIQSTITRYINFNKEKYPHFFMINTGHYCVDVYLVALSKIIGFPEGDCPYSSIEKKCPHVDIDFGYYTELDIDSYEYAISYEHSHMGNWRTCYSSKIGYDRNLTMLFFKNLMDKKIAVNLHVLGENYWVL